MDEEELAWDVVRDRINIDIESGEFTALDKVWSDDMATDFLLKPKFFQDFDENPEFTKEGPAELLDLDDQQPGPSSQKIPKRPLGRPRNASNPSGFFLEEEIFCSNFRILDNLLGQANLEHARGRTKEAMDFLFEVRSPKNLKPG